MDKSLDEIVAERKAEAKKSQKAKKAKSARRPPSRRVDTATVLTHP
jgi:hypothetical protein